VSTTTPTAAPSERTTVKRHPERGSYDRDLAYAILDEGLVCHVGIATDHGPVVIPTTYARMGDHLVLHGSPASRLLRAGASGVDVCVTVTLLDGLVLARSAFHHSMNYRSVVVFGHAEPITDPDAKRAAIDVLVEHIVPGRAQHARAPSDKELKGTLVLSLPLRELSVKQRAGGPLDDDEDMAMPIWAGVLPAVAGWGEPVADDGVDAPAPGYVTRYSR
jgi:nitroimidazol reductase NimA-like FMN-containing flavoprotein (pyridoxamine 5'-phosphate oxidase superfamily)